MTRGECRCITSPWAISVMKKGLIRQHALIQLLQGAGFMLVNVSRDCMHEKPLFKSFPELPLNPKLVEFSRS